MPSLQRKEILVIDDAADIRVFVKRILEGDGALVTEAGGIEQGLVFVGVKPPHLIITDLSMPGKSGFDLLKRRRDDAALGAIPMIVLSGKADRESVAQAIALGATDYILKPIRANLLLQKVRKRLKSVSFNSCVFPPDERPRATVSLSVEILKAGEIGVQIESAVKLAPEQSVALTGEFLEKLGCGDLMTRTAQRPEPYLFKDRYVSELVFVGIGENDAKKIRKQLKEWK